MRNGVSIVDPQSTWIDVTVTLENDVTILPGTQLHGATNVATGTVIGPDTTLTDVTVKENATVTRAHGQGAIIGTGATVGPFAYLRPGTVLGEDSKLGTFCEAKNSQIGDGAKVPHLTYVGMQKSATERTSAPGLFSQITTGSPRTALLLVRTPVWGPAVSTLPP